MTSEYQLAKKKKQPKEQQNPQTQPTHRHPSGAVSPPMFSSYPTSFCAASKPAAFSFPKKHAASERAKQGQSRG